MPDPILVGRNAEKIAALAKAARHRALDHRSRRGAGEPERHGLLRRRDHADARRAARRRRSRPASTSIARSRSPDTLDGGARRSPKLAKQTGIKNGVVQDKLFLPGLRKLEMLRDAGFFGRMLAVRGEFGYWVFEGDWQPAQRPSWNYSKADGGGIILDMLCHWRYVLDNLFGEVQAVSCLGATHIPERVRRERQDLQGRRRRRRLRDLPARGRRDRAHQLVLGDARAARRPGHVPGRRHARLGGRRADALRHADRA